MKLKSLKMNAILNSIQTIMGMIFPLITFPYVSRILEAANIGKVNFGNSIISYFSLLAVFGVQNYAVREGSLLKDTKDQFDKFSNQMFSIQILSMLFSYVCYGILLMTSEKLQLYTGLLIVQSIILPLTALSCSWMMVIFEDFFYITVRSILIQLISLLMMFTFVQSQDDYIIYAGVTVFASGIGTVFNFFRARKYSKLKIILDLNLKKHFGSLWAFFVSNITSTIYVSSDTTLLGLLCTDYTVGLYSAATKVYIIVKQLLNGAITVTTPRLTNLFVKDKYAYLVLLEKIVNTLIVLILPAAAGLTALCMPIITVFAGNSYMEGALALAILAMALLFSIFANVFFQGILMPKRMEKTITRVAIISALVNIILNLLLIPIYQQNAAAFTTLIAEIIVFLFGLVYGKDELCLIEWKKTFCHATSATATFILYLAIMNHIHIFSSSGILLLAVNIPVCVFIYCFIMFTLKDEHFLYFINAVVIQVINNVKKERNYK